MMTDDDKEFSELSGQVEHVNVRKRNRFTSKNSRIVTSGKAVKPLSTTGKPVINWLPLTKKLGDSRHPAAVMLLVQPHEATKTSAAEKQTWFIAPKSAALRSPTPFAWLDRRRPINSYAGVQRLLPITAC